MKKKSLEKLLALLLVLAMCFSLLPVSALAEGDGQEDDVELVIEDPEDDFPEEEVEASPVPESLDDDEPCEHNYIAVVTEPTPEKGGYTTYTCSLCGDSYIDDYTDPVVFTPNALLETHVHSLEFYPAVEPTCIFGNIAYWYCSGCGKYFADEDAEAELTPEEVFIRQPHTWSEWFVETEPTQTQPGLRKRICTACGTAYEEESIPATWITDGYEIFLVASDQGVYDTYTGGDTTILASSTLIAELTEAAGGGYGYVGVHLAHEGLFDYELRAGEDFIAWDQYVQIKSSYLATLSNGTYMLWVDDKNDPGTLVDGILSTGRYTNTVPVYVLKEDQPNIIASGTCGKNGNNLAWTLNTKGTLTISGTGDMADYNNYDTYISNDPPWYSYRTSILRVEIGQDVTSIGNCALTNCTALTSAVIPSSVTSIGDYAFSDCNVLRNITIPSGVTSIGNSTFANCYGLTCISILGNLTGIGAYAFYECSNLTDFNIPDSVTNIGDYAFYRCSNLTNFNIPENVTNIGDYAFYECISFTTLTIPSNTTSIGEFAFCRCSSLTSMTMLEGVTTIGDGAFSGCTSLINLIVPESVTSIGEYIFNGCTGLRNVIILGKVSGIGKFAFSGCTNLENVSIPDSVTAIAYGAFENCSSLTGITIPSAVTSIGNTAFFGCSSLYSVTMSEGVTIIGEQAFWECSSLRSVTIPSSVVYIGFGAFYKCSSLYSVTMSEGVTTIGDAAFNLCTSLNKITIPESVTSIGEYVFSGCSSLRSANISGRVTHIGKCAFYACTNLENVTIPDSVTTIGEDAFRKCSRLRSVNIPWSVTSIGDSAFESCGLTSVTIPSSMTNIGNKVFFKCYSLTSVTIPSSIVSIGDSAFASCGLTSVTIPSGVSSIGANAFSSCSSLMSVTILDGVTNTGVGAFSGCRSLMSVTLPSTLTNIGQSSFEQCSLLPSITIPDSVTSIDDNAFHMCNNLSDVYYWGDDTKWNQLKQNTGTNNQPLLNATPHLNSTGPEEYDYGYVQNDSTRFHLIMNVENLVRTTSSTVFNPDLAFFLAAMSRAVYKERDIRESLVSMDFDYDHAETRFRDDPQHYTSGFVIAGKDFQENGENKKLVIITIRGSVGYNWNNLLKLGDSWNGAGQYPALRDDAESVHYALKNHFFSGSIPDTGDTIYVITGHSQGAGAANILASMLYYDNVPTSCIYNYNFACPNVACFTNNSNWNPDGRYDYIFNFGNAQDPVPLIPNVECLALISTLLMPLHPMYPTIPGTKWGKYGRSYWFYPDKENLEAHGVGHDMLNYLRHMAMKQPLAAYSPSELALPGAWWRVIVCRCPVDVDVFDTEGNPIASVTDNQPFYEDSNKAVMIFVDEDRKCVLLPAGREFDVWLTATDDGEMEFAVLDCNILSGEISMEKEFSGVSLISGKTMISNAGGETPVENVRLIVLDENEDPIREVLEDGTEILYLADLSSRSEPLTIDREYLLLKPDDTVTLTLTNVPAEWAPYVVWSSEDESVASVDAFGKVTALSEGTTWISASVDTGAGVLSARCRVDVVESQAPEGEPEDPHPIATDLNVDGVRLIDTKATVELYKTDYTRIRVIPELSQNQTASAAAPAIVSPPPVPANSGAAITAAVFDDTNNGDINDLFALHVVDDRTLEIIPSYEALELGAANSKTLKGSYKAAVIVTVDGTEFTTAPLTLTVKKTQPKVTVKALKFNSFLLGEMPQTGETMPLDFGGISIHTVEKDTSKVSAEWLVLNDDQTVTYAGARNAKLSGKLNLLVQPEGWTVKIPVAVSVSAASTKPKLTFKPATLSLQPVGSDSATAAYTVTPAQFADCEIEVVSITGGREHPEQELLIASDRGQVFVTTTSATPGDGKAYTYKVTLGVVYKDETVATAVLTVKLLAKKAATLSLKVTGGIDLAVDNSPVTIVPTLKNVGKNVTFEVSDICDASGASMMAEGLFDISGLMLTGTDELKDTLLPGQQAKYTAAVTATYPGGSVSKTVPFTVKHSAKAPAASVTLKASGFIDVIRPGSSVTLTPTVKNLYGYTLSPEDLSIVKTYDGATKQKTNDTANDLFTVAVEDGRYVVTGNTGLSHLDKFTVTAKIGGVPSKAVALAVKMGTVKITQSAKAVTLLKTDKYSTGTVLITPTDATLSAIDWGKSESEFASPLFTLRHLGGGEFAIGFKGGQAPKAGTVKIPVFFTGNMTNKPNATISVSVKLA